MQFDTYNILFTIVEKIDKVLSDETLDSAEIEMLEESRKTIVDLIKSNEEVTIGETRWKLVNTEVNL